MRLQETGVDPALFLADVQLRCCWIFYFFFNPVMFLPGIFLQRLFVFIGSLGFGLPYYFFVFFFWITYFPLGHSL